MKRRAFRSASIILTLIPLLATGWADLAYAKNQYCSDETAILFGLKIKQAVKERSLRKLSYLFSDESEYVPPADYLKGKKFSDVFSDKWQAELLSSETVCNWSKGPKVGNVWFEYYYDTPPPYDERKCCKIYSINGWIDQALYGPGKAFGPKGEMPPNVLDVTAVKENELLWALHSGSYKLGPHQTLQSTISQCEYTEGQQFEDLRLTIAKGGVTLSRNGQDVKAAAKYFGAAFQLPFNGHCGSAGCSYGISGHSYIYKLSKPVITGECIEDFRYIIVAFNSDQWAYNRVFLSGLSSTDEDQDDINLDELERSNFQTTKVHVYADSFFRLKPITKEAKVR